MPCNFKFKRLPLRMHKRFAWKYDVIRMLNFVHLILFLDMFPLDSRCPLANEISQHTYTTYYASGIMGLGGIGLSKPKKTTYN